MLEWRCQCGKWNVLHMKYYGLGACYPTYNKYEIAPYPWTGRRMKNHDGHPLTLGLRHPVQHIANKNKDCKHCDHCLCYYNPKTIDTVGKFIITTIRPECTKCRLKKNEALYFTSRVMANVNTKMYHFEKLEKEMTYCQCDNAVYGCDCICDWVKNNPGDKHFSCEYCGVYEASKPQCKHCEEYNNE